MSDKLNALCFGGGGLVGTSKALGHLVGLDQLVREPHTREELKPSFFDYMAARGEATVRRPRLDPLRIHID